MWVSSNNQQIIEDGYFPEGKLCAATEEDYITASEKKRLETINPSFCRVLNLCIKAEAICSSVDRQASVASYYELAKKMMELDSEVAFAINTGYFDSTLFSDESFIASAIEKSPFVTEFDALLYYYTSFYMFMAKQSAECEQFAAFCVGLLRVIQKKEEESRLTIDRTKANTEGFDLFSIITDAWNENNPFLISISQVEHGQLASLLNFREIIARRVKEELSKELYVAQRTEVSWSRWIDIVNQAKNIEKDTIIEVLQSNNPDIKAAKIIQYFNWFDSIENGNIEPIEGLSEKYESLRTNVFERINSAKHYCLLKESDKTYYVNNALMELMDQHRHSFNYIFLAFHLFRLNHSKENALRFMNSAYNSLRSNLLEVISVEEKPDSNSIADIAENYLQLISFIADREGSFSEVSFVDVQEDVSSYGDVGFIAKNEWSEFLGETMEPMVKNFAATNMDEMEAVLPQLIQPLLEWRTQLLNTSWGKLAMSFVGEEEIDEKTMVEMGLRFLERRIVKSVNVIFLVCEMLRMLLAEQIQDYGVEDKENLGRIRKKLQMYEEKIAYSVYGRVGSLRDFQEQRGIASISIAEKENEYIKSSHEHQILVMEQQQLNVLGGIHKMLVSDSVNKIQEVREELKRSLRQFPCLEGDYSEELANKIEKISYEISERLVAVCEKEIEFPSCREKTKKKLNLLTRQIPTVSLNTLVTAEMLFEKYAREEYAEQGFDYSSISALYYQAFESLYNEMIWKRYSEYLNLLEIDGVAFGEYIREASEPKDKKVEGNENEVRLRKTEYINVGRHFKSLFIYEENKVIISNHCMYKQFSDMLSDSLPKSKGKKPRLYGFSSYLATLFGFDSAESMWNDYRFNKKLVAFNQSIKKSVPNRNNASHGGVMITYAQCTQDKETVLKRVRKDRNDKIGLILQLLDMLYR